MYNGKYMKIIWVILALLGMLLWYIPGTISLFSGQHSYYNINANGSQIPCQKCHGDVSVELHTGYIHDNFTCNDCHRIQKGVQYASGDGANNTTPGMMAHAASLVKCVECHGEFINNTPDIVHDAFIKYGIENDVNDDCISCHSAVATSITWTKPGAMGIVTVSNGTINAIINITVPYRQRVETFGNQSGDVIAVSNITVI